MRIAVIGTGAVGGYYGGLLARNGHDVHFLLNSDYDHVKKFGLKVDSPKGDFELSRVNAWKSALEMPRCDLVIVALKTTANHLLKDILPEVVHENSKVIVLQNGLDVDSDVAKIVPHCRIFGGLCFLCSNKIAPGHIRHLDYGTIRLGEFLIGGEVAGITEGLLEIRDVFNNVSIHIDLSEDISEARWRKLVWNIPFNGLCTVLRSDTKRLVSHESSRDQLYVLMREVLIAAAANGKLIEDSFMDEMMALSDNMEAYKPSMLLDLESGRELEVEEMFLGPLAVGLRKGALLPNIQFLTRQLDFINNR
ncbi:MAG: putative 2-dehydropantoate 2-reductase [Lentisphaeraceae bacterium]|nr:putative 2-dehydropantoate 2-reductase [Lentisphaeraceae bacterium]